ncbi:2,3-bisphosphoglycerate-independent phosphoglycerate mutase [Blattabacterium cuenoti]|uniref:2,3-bisphosphoglycerate-independent phosphoglycerate mutase n=1 Tax=Blattabacterium cuenoti TaxID=1653831 RepID=UPI0019320A1B|nr:2,3-bisphosphoglycerate-independent phosphoglycerate mutase [Blattabacterium cuenoti]
MSSNIKKIMLMILDGWGISNPENVDVSAIEQAQTPFIDFCYRKYPSINIHASGQYVGLPYNQAGNSEVGHIHLGSGRKVTQSLEKINLAIKNNHLSYDIDPILNYVSFYKKKLHFIGLLSDGGVHSHINHLIYLLKLANNKKLSQVFVHVFTDGRDSDPKKGILYIKTLLDVMKQTVGQLSTVMGRYYAMDRNNKWERTQIAFDAMVHAKGIKTRNIFDYLEKSYQDGHTDEFLYPSIIVDKLYNPISQIETNDVVFCFNFRPDRSKQITELFIQDKHKLNLYYITMTSYSYDLKYKNVHVICNQKKLSNTLGEILANEGKKQLRIAESEKYPHVTFFFSGGEEAAFIGEKRKICLSPKVSTYDLAPKMSAKKIVNMIIPELNSQNADFICLNFANPDMVGHTGNMLKTIEACEYIDNCVKICYQIAMKNMYSIIIVGDHGNADYMINKDGTPNTSHTTSLVPFILIDPEYYFIETKETKHFLIKEQCSLCDVAPTILQLMNLNVPNIMSGHSIINKI